MSNLKQLKCPSCGAILKQSFPDQLIVECPYCHQQVVNDTYRFSGKSNEPRILEFSMNESDVVKTMTDMLIEDPCVPTDIFEKMNIISIRKYYVPMYIYEGTYRAPWTAQIARHEKRQQIGKDGKVEDYYETLYDYPSGEAAGNFSVNGIPSREMNTLRLNPDELQNFTINPTSLPYFSSVSQIIDEGIVLLSPSEESNSVWLKSGENSAQNVGIAAAISQSPGPTKCSASCELKNTSFVYIPIWIMDYSYNSKNYYYIFYAERFGSITNPICEMPTAQPTDEQMEILNRNKDTRDKFEGMNSLVFLCIIAGELSLFIGKIFGIGFLEDLASDGWFFWFILIGGFFYVAIGLFHNEEKLNEMEEGISKEIEDRTQLLLSKAETYKRDTCILIMKSYNGNNKGKKDSMDNNEIDNKSANSEISSTLSNSCDNKQTKTCIHCGKKISVSHMFCRYCGAKQG